MIEAFSAPRDLDALLMLNNAHVDEIGLIGREALLALTERAVCARTARDGETLLGALIGLARGADYDSLNYRRFETRDAAPFLYIDRVIVAPEARGRGTGRALYDDAARIARERGLERLVCEVNVSPPNPGSMAFHRRQGFRTIELFDNPQSGKRVAMLERRLLISGPDPKASPLKPRPC